MLTQILIEAISNEKLSYLAQNIAEAGKNLARNLMVTECIEGYSMLLENVLMFPSEVAIPTNVTGIPSKLKQEWQWDLLGKIAHTSKHLDNDMKRRSSSIVTIVDKIEDKWNSLRKKDSLHTIKLLDEAFLPINWEEERDIEIVNSRKILLDQEVSLSFFYSLIYFIVVKPQTQEKLVVQLNDRTDQIHQTWEEVDRNVKRIKKKHGVRDRDDRELERVGQPLCIYEPYFGEGTLPFLHNSPLYRGIGLVS